MEEEGKEGKGWEVGVGEKVIEREAERERLEVGNEMNSCFS